MMAELWSRMIEMYGHKFTSSFGEVPSDTWSRALSGCSAEDLAQGIRACFTRQDTWPPTLPEFVEMCRAQPRSLYFHSPAQQGLLENHSPEKRSTALEHISQIKQMLRGTNAAVYETESETDRRQLAERVVEKLAPTAQPDYDELNPPPIA